ncbi:Imm21 family immunity protein [Nocardia sp. NPDC046473]|uniref:Imm21 family immunity protein n=1 Tax=Nocardia sp. NPDC046473 TaxID=3155733 RepID=UPI0033C9B82B
MASPGGALIVIPVSVVNLWTGSTPTGRLGGTGETIDDYDRACAILDYAALITVGESGAQALVLGDEPSTTCYLSEHRCFLRLYYADDEDELIADAKATLAHEAIEWQECGIWETDGPGVLMDSVYPGLDLSAANPDGVLPDQAPVPLGAGRWLVRAARIEHDRNGMDLIQLLPVDPPNASY